MKVKVPKQIKIATHPCQIFFKSNLLIDENKFGYAHRRLQRICIEPSSPISVKNVTLLHEILHYIDDIYHINIDDNTIDRIAQGCAEFLFNNLDIELDWTDITELAED